MQLRIIIPANVVVVFLTGVPQPHFLTALCLACGGAVIYTNSLDLFSSTMNLRRKYAPLPEEGWLTDEFWGLFPLLEWVGCVTALVFLVSGRVVPPGEWVGGTFLVSGWVVPPSEWAQWVVPPGEVCSDDLTLHRHCT